VNLPNSDRLSKTHHRQANQCKNAVGNDPWRSDVVLVTSPGEAVHDEASEDVWRRDEAVGCSWAEAHAVFEDDREEVGDSVGNGGRHHEYHRKAPDLEVERALEVFGHVELLGNDIVAVLKIKC